MDDLSVPPSAGPYPTGVPTKYCFACGQSIDARAEICPKCGVRQPGIAVAGRQNSAARAPAVPSPPLTRWLAAVVIGVVVSVAASIALSAIGLSSAGSYIPTLLGLAIGIFVAGRVLPARSAGQWVMAGLATFFGQILLGIAVYAFFIR